MSNNKLELVEDERLHLEHTVPVINAKVKEKRMFCESFRNTTPLFKMVEIERLDDAD